MNAAGVVGMIVLAGVGVIFAGIVSTLKLVRSANMPLLTYVDRDGIKVHGFLRWWGTLSLLFVGPLAVVYTVVTVTGIVDRFVSNLGYYVG